MNKQKTGELIKEARLLKNYTQTELGDLIGVSNKAVSRWENGESFPDIGILESLSEVLNLPIESIVLGEKTIDQSKEAMQELIRTAKMQKQEAKRSKWQQYLCVSFWILLVLGLLMGIFHNHPVTAIDKDVFYKGMLAILLAILCKIGLMKGESLFEKTKCYQRWYMLATGGLLFYITALLFISFVMAKDGVILFDLELYELGPFLNNQLIALAVMAFVGSIYFWYRRARFEDDIIGGVMIFTSAIFLCLLYSELLYRISTFEGVIHMLISDVVFVVVAEVAAFVLYSFFRKIKNSENND